MRLKGICSSGALVLGALFLTAAGQPAQAATSAVTFTRVGNPMWMPVDGNLFSAPIGTASDNFAGFATTEGAILPPPNHLVNAATSEVIPGAPHAGPYDQEISNGVTAQGYPRGPVFSVGDFSNGNAVWVAFTVIPGAGAPTGKTPDYASGPIVPNSIFPIALMGDTTRNGVDFDPNWGGNTPDVNTILGLSTPQFDGYSSLPFFDAEASEFGPTGVPPTGIYASSWTYLDATGNGWRVAAQYSVAVPLPPAVWMALPLLVLPALRRPLRLIQCRT